MKKIPISPDTKSAIKELHKYYVIFIFLGITLIVLSEVVINQDWIVGYKMFSAVSSTCGTTFVIAGLFSGITGHSSFLNDITLILQKVIMEQNFLSCVSEKKKAEIIKHIILSSNNNEKNTNYIDKYYEKCIKNTLAISSNYTRSNFIVEVNAIIDTDSKGRDLVIVNENFSYILYPSLNGYLKPIEIILDDHQLNSEFKLLTIKDENDNLLFKLEDLDIKDIGKDKEIGDITIKRSRQSYRGKEVNVFKIDIKKLDRYSEIQRLALNCNIRITGNDHWGFITILNLIASRDFTFILRYDHGLKIADYKCFSQYNFDIEHQESIQYLKISSNRWIDAGEGIAIIVSKNH